jgi:hypothetical protein
MEIVCNIEIIKAGVDFVVKVHLPNGSIREYRHHVFEDVLNVALLFFENNDNRCKLIPFFIFYLLYTPL